MVSLRWSATTTLTARHSLPVQVLSTTCKETTLPHGASPKSRLLRSTETGQRSPSASVQHPRIGRMAYIGVEARGDQFVTFLAAEGAQTQGGCPSHEMTLIYRCRSRVSTDDDCGRNDLRDRKVVPTYLPYKRVSYKRPRQLCGKC